MIQKMCLQQRFETKQKGDKVKKKNNKAMSGTRLLTDSDKIVLRRKRPVPTKPGGKERKFL